MKDEYQGGERDQPCQMLLQVKSGEDQELSIRFNKMEVTGDCDKFRRRGGGDSWRGLEKNEDRNGSQGIFHGVLLQRREEKKKGGCKGK